MISVTKGKKPVWSRDFPDNMLADLCPMYAGGGYTAAQTAKAMLAQDELLSTGATKINGFKLVMTTEGRP